ncbi:hypothetical protein E2C01_072684 [Portunus trituberculatus]|uniref:Uncharacterized protein n=1 Tax=Portunus trituberculatus TaxID=210409 RepID=A0A5B7I372_PORTR|nr:hypothetical protein [Portunus trituberculatus]
MTSLDYRTCSWNERIESSEGLPSRCRSGTPARDGEGGVVSSGSQRLSVAGCVTPAATHVRGDGVGAAGNTDLVAAGAWGLASSSPVGDAAVIGPTVGASASGRPGESVTHTATQRATRKSMHGGVRRQ